jgi:hypothetical protein
MVEQAPKGLTIILGRLGWAVNNLKHVVHDDRSIFPEDVPDLIENQQSLRYMPMGLHERSIGDEETMDTLAVTRTTMMEEGYTVPNQLL